MKSLLAYLAVQAVIVLFLAITAPMVMAVAVGMGLAIGWSFYLFVKWLGFGSRGVKARRGEKTGRR